VEGEPNQDGDPGFEVATEAKRIEKAVKDQLSRSAVLDILIQPHWKSWSGLMRTKDGHCRLNWPVHSPKEELTLIKAIKDYLQADPKHRSEKEPLCD